MALIIEYKDGKVEQVSNNISPIWLMSKMKKGVKFIVEINSQTFIVDNFKELKPLLEKIEEKQIKERVEYEKEQK